MSSCRLPPFFHGDDHRNLGDGPDEVGPFSIDDRRYGSDHAAALQRVCRIGGLQFDSLSKSTKYLANDFAPEIRAVFGVDVRNDLDRVHTPQYLPFMRPCSVLLFCRRIMEA